MQLKTDDESRIEEYLGTTSANFRQIYSDLRLVVERVFPHTKEVFEYKMPGWKVATNQEIPKNWKGTLDPRWLTIYLVERKAGLTLHIWNPNDYYFLDKNKTLLTSAGFIVMRGCLQFNTKKAYPIRVVEELLRKIEI